MDNTSEQNVKLGVDVMDQEHQLEFKMLDSLKLVIGRAEWAEAQAISVQLFDYVQTHFLSEELLMRVHAFPQYDAHIYAHSKLITQIEKLTKFLSETPGEPHGIKMIEGLKETLLDHVIEMDSGLARYLLENGKTQDFANRV